MADGGLYLDDVQWTTDPEVYQPFNWPRRQSIDQGIGRSVTIQDFGRTEKDLTVHMESGENQMLASACVDALDALNDGTPHTFKDFLGNEYSVVMIDFTPVPTRLPDLDGNGAIIGQLYRYTMNLRVLSISKLRGVTYSGG